MVHHFVLVVMVVVAAWRDHPQLERASPRFHHRPFSSWRASTFCFSCSAEMSSSKKSLSATFLGGYMQTSTSTVLHCSITSTEQCSTSIQYKLLKAFGTELEPMLYMYLEHSVLYWNSVLHKYSEHSVL